MKFYGDMLGLELASEFPERKVAFYWMGGRGRSMLGIWEAGGGPQRLILHSVFTVRLEDLLEAPQRLRAANISPLDFSGNPTEEPVVLAWMPAAAIFFHDPDGNQLEFVSMLPDPPLPELGVVNWSRWQSR